MKTEDKHQYMLRARGVGAWNACERCVGSGTILYSSTATWRGGTGGAAMTYDACDLCWGSGTKKPWPSHREFYQMKKQSEAKSK